MVYTVSVVYTVVLLDYGQKRLKITCSVIVQLWVYLPFVQKYV